MAPIPRTQTVRRGVEAPFEALPIHAWRALIGLRGDTACVFETRGKRRFKPLDDKGDDLLRVFLPLSADGVLVGTAAAACPELDVVSLNKAIVQCSDEFFVSAGR